MWDFIRVKLIIRGWLYIDKSLFWFHLIYVLTFLKDILSFDLMLHCLKFMKTSVEIFNWIQSMYIYGGCFWKFWSLIKGGITFLLSLSFETWLLEFWYLIFFLALNDSTFVSAYFRCNVKVVKYAVFYNPRLTM